jgi:hypothetical protein
MSPSVLIVTKSRLSLQLPHPDAPHAEGDAASVSASEVVRAICTFCLTELRSPAQPPPGNSIGVENHMRPRLGKSPLP